MSGDGIDSSFPTAPPPGEVGGVTPIVLVVSDRIGEHDSLPEMLRAAGFEPVLRARGADAERAARYVLPDVVVVDETIADGPTADFIASVRGAASRLAAVPVVALVPRGDRDATSAHVAAGADLCLATSTRVADVVAQIAALIRLSLRCRLGAASIERPREPSASLCNGDLAQISAASFLTLLEMERQSGVLELATSGATARLEVVRGRLVRSAVDDVGVDPVTALGVVLSWSVGHFAFYASPSGGSNTGAPAVGEAIDAALRLAPEALAPARRS